VSGCHVDGMTTLFRTMALVLAFAMASAVAGCSGSGIPQDDRYQTHRNASWDNWRG
jgi:hypothetical protein